MRYISSFSLLAIAAMGNVACGDNSNSANGTSALYQAPIIRADQGTSVQAAVLPVAPAPASPDAGAPDRSWIVTVPMPPWTQCTAYPEGVSDDPARTDSIFAGTDGELRFYPPPPSWGTTLTLACALNGGTQTTYLVDLNDPTTFTQKSQFDLAPNVVGVRPPLTGDLTAVLPADLLKGLYPARPDPVRAPQRYAQWISNVTLPYTIYRAKLVANLGEHMSGSTGAYVGSESSNWSGFIQGVVPPSAES
jgi:hypothetical protein